MRTPEPVAEERNRTPAFKTICSLCMGDALAYYGGTLYCWQCLEPLIRKGLSFKSSIEIKAAR